MNLDFPDEQIKYDFAWLCVEIIKEIMIETGCELSKAQQSVCEYYNITKKQLRNLLRQYKEFKKFAYFVYKYDYKNQRFLFEAEKFKNEEKVLTKMKRKLYKKYEDKYSNKDVKIIYKTVVNFF